MAILIGISVGTIIGLYFYAQDNIWMSAEEERIARKAFDTLSPEWQLYWCYRSQGFNCPPEWGHAFLIGGVFGVPLVISGIFLFLANWHQESSVPEPKPEPKRRKRRRG